MSNSQDALLVKQRDALRKELRMRRNNLSDQEVKTLSSHILQRLLSILGNTQKIGSYLAFGKEVNLAAFNSAKLHSCFTIHVPIVQQGHRMVFAPVNPKTQYELNQYGIREPIVDPDELVTANLLDTVLVPLVGFDRECNRMGMGGGYYDRAFSQRQQTTAKENCPRLIGVAYECQLVDSVLPAPWDVPLDCVVTESNIYVRNG